jgi:hypothetical protein
MGFGPGRALAAAVARIGIERRLPPDTFGARAPRVSLWVDRFVRPVIALPRVRSGGQTVETVAHE